MMRLSFPLPVVICMVLPHIGVLALCSVVRLFQDDCVRPHSAVPNKTVGQLKRQVKGSALCPEDFLLTNRPDTLIGQQCAALGGQKLSGSTFLS